MKKEDVWNAEVNPDGISSEIDGLTDLVWSRGYYCETDDGIWYEVYVNDDLKYYFYICIASCRSIVLTTSVYYFVYLNTTVISKLSNGLV